MKSSLFAALLVTALVAGCKKSETAANSTPPAAPDQTTATATDTASTPPAPPSGEPVQMPAAGANSPTISSPTDGNVGRTLGDLSLAARQYITGTHNIPKDFADFAAKSHINIPPPPAGKKYAFDKRYRVILVNQ